MQNVKKALFFLIFASQQSFGLSPIGNSIKDFQAILDLATKKFHTFDQIAEVKIDGTNFDLVSKLGCTIHGALEEKHIFSISTIGQYEISAKVVSFEEGTDDRACNRLE